MGREGTRGHGDMRARGKRNTRGPEAQRLGWPENIFGSQVSAAGSQVRVFRFRYGCGCG
jgi:hypothetical protein